ncbi:hypothetical protein [Neobacillus vireti]|uniref:Uncharacterized protein n=1 Tax=Neobacillus vireti LMG 21834 TaxID=1131730 RepID=A0AB94IL34_9BACI|nr:hypothetical protein [Neobacillus vireti]ETI67754.1 hypothetical protein BAVI_15942 [Neobacillus vireti LMG 21834]KLT16118.1 hypothetical protein AA980_19320 [Neobacillus vireti]
MRLFPPKEKNQIKIENNNEYNYILEWSKRNSIINDLKSLYDFIFRKYSEEELNKFGEEPLKVAWNSLSDVEQNILTCELSEVYRNRIK